MASTNYSSAQYISFQQDTTEAPGHNTTRADAAGQDAVHLEATTAWIPMTPITLEARRSKSMKPVVIPRVDTVSRLAAPMPFMRAFSPDLQLHDINAQEFLAFLDNLAVAEAAPVPLQALNMAGSFVGAIPYHWATAAGFGMNAAAGLGSAAVITIRTRHFLETVNREYFAPRGLKVYICKYKELVEKLGCRQYLPDSEPSNADMVHMSLRDRYMQALMPYVAPLSFDVPPPTEQRSLIDKMSAKQIERRVQKNKKKEEQEAGKTRHKHENISTMHAASDAHRGRYDSDSSSDSSSDSKEDRKRKKKLRKAERREEKSERRETKSERRHDEKISKAKKKQEKKVDKENEKAARIEFLVVEEMGLPC